MRRVDKTRCSCGKCLGRLLEVVAAIARPISITGRRPPLVVARERTDGCRLGSAGVLYDDCKLMTLALEDMGKEEDEGIKGRGRVPPEPVVP